MPLPSISPRDAATRAQQGAAIIDIRAADEFAREHIADAHNIPFENLSPQSLAALAGQPLIFQCRSGMRTQTNAARLSSLATGEAFILEGGIDAWKAAGQSVIKDASQPLELQRQVQIGAGSLALGGFILGVTVSPYFHAISGFVGAGLLFAGLTGFCGMAKILMRMPWNNRG